MPGSALIMPKLGMYTDDVLLLEWAVAEGGAVALGDVVFVLETEKTTAEVQAEAEGFLHRTVEAGAVVPIGGQVGVLAATREEYAALAASTPATVEPPNPFLGYIGAGVPARIAAGPPAAAAPVVAPPRPAPAPPVAAPAAARSEEETLRWLHRTMVTIRVFDERVAREFRTGEIPGFVHTYVGEEAVAAGVCAHLRASDWVTSTHRGHGHCIAKGCELGPMMAEIYGRETGLCAGRGGSMHIADFSKGMLGANAIVGGGIALATGAALAARVGGTGAVAVSFFGDGAANQGVLHESLNLAAIWRLPVLYVCENNGFAESTPAAYATSVPDVALRAAGYGIPGVVVDADDVLAVYEAAGDAVARARAGDGPTLLEVKTFRIRGHFEGDPDRYRDDDERRATAERDPIPPFERLLVERGIADAPALAAVRAEAEAAVDAAVEFARASPWPDPAELERHVYPATA
jgi:acetoin:2,6-dichlorophenolindophenol oxidoreductase subunit alpha